MTLADREDHQLILFRERHLTRALDQSMVYTTGTGNHQGLGNRPLVQRPADGLAPAFTAMSVEHRQQSEQEHASGAGARYSGWVTPSSWRINHLAAGQGLRRTGAAGTGNAAGRRCTHQLECGTSSGPSPSFAHPAAEA
jgi:hypothetical protein